MPINHYEKIIQTILLLSAVTSIFIVLVLTITIFLEGNNALANWVFNGFGYEYDKTTGKYGIIQLVFVSIYLGLGSTIIASVVGIPCAIYMSEFADEKIRIGLKQIFESMTSIPSIIIGLFSFVVLSNLTYRISGGQAGASIFSGWIVLAIMSLPYIITIADDVFRAVPISYKEASLALGASKWQTITKIVIPTAKNGVITAVLLSLGRAIGETTAVALAIGGAIPDLSILTFYPFKSSNCVTTTIIHEIPDTLFGSLAWSSLYGMASIILVLIMIMNLIAQRLRKKI